MRIAALLASLAITAGCAAPGAGGAEARSGTVDEAKQTLLAARLSDARGGKSFTLKDFGGKVVIVMGIAVW